MQICLVLQKSCEVAALVFNSLILEIHINHLGVLAELCNAFKHLLNLLDRSLFSLRTLMVKTGQRRSCQGLDDLARLPVAMCNRHNVVFNRLRFKNVSFR